MEADAVPFDKFEVVRKLGRGGMGTVYEAYDPTLDRRVAIKTLTTDAIADEESRRRFEREARAAAKLQHPNIVTIYELGNFGSKGKPYIVMEYLDGTDLASLVGRDKQLPFAEALEITVQICRALDFAHQHDVVHRDVKPSNVRLLDDGRVKIMDFGIARIEGGDEITRSGVMVGTPHYMSPEQIKGDKLIDGRSDVFSSGCILYEMLGGKRPFHGESTTSILYKIVNESAPPLLRDHPDLPQEIEEIVRHALAKNPAERYQSAGAMAEELEKLLSAYRMSFPRLPSEVQRRLEDLERVDRERNWAEAARRAAALVAVRPDLAGPRRILRKAERMLRLEAEVGGLTPSEKTRHLAEISQELTALYGPGQLPTVAGRAPRHAAPTPHPTAGDLKLRTRTGAGAGEASSHAFLKAAAAVGLVLAAVALWLYWPSLIGPRDARHRLRINAGPPGSSIFVNGQDSGVQTDGTGPVEVVLEGKEGDAFVIEVRRAGYTPARRSVTLGSEPPHPLELSLDALPVEFKIRTDPPDAVVRLDGIELATTTPLEVELTPDEEHELVISKEGYESRTLKLVPGEEMPSGDISLEALAKPGTLVVESPYPLSILSKEGITLAEGSTDSSVSLRAGRREIRLHAAQVFLNHTFSVDIPEGGSTRLDAPALGKISIQAVPGNCNVIINGIPAGAPPILNASIVAGSHTIVFEWASGDRQEKTQMVRPDRHEYVTGQIR